MKPTIFIGSTSEAKPHLEKLSQKLRKFADVVKWDEGVFEVGGGTQKSLVDAIHDSDFAVFLLTAEALTEDRNKLLFSPRDNIIFEAGISFGSVSPARTFLIPERNKELKVPTDLAGFTLTDDFDAMSPDVGLSNAAKQINVAVKKLGLRSLKKRVDQSFLRNQSLQLIRNATESLTLFGRDLSWVDDYLTEIKNAISRNVAVNVICSEPSHDTWRRNVETLKGIGANVFHTTKDLGLRLTIIDHANENTSQFIFSVKERQGGQLLYKYELHDPVSSRVLWQTVCRLQDAVCSS